MRERLAAPTQEELEAMVPEAYVISMWERVRSAVAAEDVVRELGIGGRQYPRWLVPMLAAASLFLLISAGLLVGEVKRLRVREQALVQQIAEYDLRARSDLVARTAGLVGSQAWERLLSRRERLSIGDLEALLGGFGQLDATSLAASADEHLRLDHHLSA